MAQRAAGSWTERLGVANLAELLTLAGLCLFTLAIVTYRFPVAEAGVAIAVAGMALQVGKLRFPFPVWLFAAFVLWAFVASLAAPYATIALHTTGELLKLTVVMLIVVNALRTEAQLRFYLIFFVLCFLAYPVRGSLMGGETVFGRVIWGHNIYKNPNDLAALAILALGAATALMFSAPRRKLVRWGGAGVAGVLLVLILLTQSRGAFLGVIVGLAPATLVLGLKRPGLVAGLGAVLLALIVTFVPASAWERFAGIGQLASTATIAEADPEGSAEQRWQILQVAFRIFTDYPVFGVGLGAYPEAHNAYDPYLGRKSTHNTYVNLACEVGLPGLMIWLALVLSVLGYAYRRRRLAGPSEVASQQAWIERAFWAYLVASIFGTFGKLTFPYLFLAVLWSSAAMLKPAPGREDGPARAESG